MKSNVEHVTLSFPTSVPRNLISNRTSPAQQIISDEDGHLPHRHVQIQGTPPSGGSTSREQNNNKRDSQQQL